MYKLLIMKKFLFGALMILAATMMQAQSLTSLAGQHVDTILKHHVEGEGVMISNGKFNNQSGNVTFPQIAYFRDCRLILFL